MLKLVGACKWLPCHLSQIGIYLYSSFGLVGNLETTVAYNNMSRCV